MENLVIFILLCSVTIYLIVITTVVVKREIHRIRLYTKILNDKELLSEYERIMLKKMEESLSIKQIESIKRESMKEFKSKLN